MKLKNIKVGDKLEVKKSIADDWLNDILTAGDIVEVKFVEPLDYEGDLTVRVSKNGDADWTNHKHLRKPKNDNKPKIGDEYVVASVGEGIKHPKVGSKHTIMQSDYDEVTFHLDSAYVSTLRGDGRLEIEGLDTFLEKVKPKSDELEATKLTGSDLTRKMLEDGVTEIECYVCDNSDDKAVADRVKRTVTGFSNGQFQTNLFSDWRYAVPVSSVSPKPRNPKPLSRWQHRNGNIYTVTDIANQESADQDRYPVTVVYKGHNGEKTWSRPLSEWHRSMTEIED